MLITDYDIGYINNEVENRCSKLSYFTISNDSKKIVKYESKTVTYEKYRSNQNFLRKTNKNYVFKKS